MALPVFRMANSLRRATLSSMTMTQSRGSSRVFDSTSRAASCVHPADLVLARGISISLKAAISDLAVDADDEVIAVRPRTGRRCSSSTVTSTGVISTPVRNLAPAVAVGMNETDAERQATASSNGA